MIQFLLFLSIASSTPHLQFTWGEDRELDSILYTLDTLIDNRNRYVEQKIIRINSLNDKLSAENDAFKQYNLINDIITEYRTFQYDSTIVYIDKNLALAQELGREEWKTGLLITKANNYASGGLYFEAHKILEGINPDDLSYEMHRRYLLAWEQVYYQMSIYAGDPLISPKYEEMSLTCLDSLIGMTKGNTDRPKARRLIYLKEYERAAVILTELIEKGDYDDRNDAMIMSSLSNAYEGLGNTRMQMKYLALAAINDIKLGVRENQALRKLSVLLYRGGQIKLSYKFCSISMDDAEKYNARLRRIESSDTFSIVEKSYLEIINRQQLRIMLFAIIAGALCLLAIVLALILKKQNNMIRKSLKMLEEINDRLIESNNVKEKYVSLFLSKCSDYITQYNRFVSRVHNKLTQRKYAELKEETDIQAKDSYKEFYSEFDKAFLSLYPTFVEKVNELLRQEEALEVEKENSLSPALRMLAIIRLGISDSSQIAKFLNYSPNTIYTYRTKIKSKAKNKDSFEADVMKIGLYSSKGS